MQLHDSKLVKTEHTHIYIYRTQATNRVWKLRLTKVGDLDLVLIRQ